MNKKYYLALAATAALFAGCSSDDNFADEARMAAVNDGDRAAIQLQIGDLQGTRGSGTVGGLNGADDNYWGGQKFKVSMFNKNTLDYALSDPNDATSIIYQDQDFTTPNIVGAGVPFTNNIARVVTDADTKDGGLEIAENVSYFPQEGNFDFWAYRLDDAMTAAPTPNTAGDALEAEFSINGSQDIMVAKAEPKASLDNGDGTWGGDNVPEGRVFSAYSVRRGVTPILNFTHLLTRLQFKVKASENLSVKTANVNNPTPTEIAGNPNAVRVTAIKVRSLANGKLVTAYTAATAPQLITWTDGSEDFLPLKQRGKEMLTPYRYAFTDNMYTGADDAVKTFAAPGSGTTTRATWTEGVYGSTETAADGTPSGTYYTSVAAAIAALNADPTLPKEFYAAQWVSDPTYGAPDVSKDLDPLDPVNPLWDMSGGGAGVQYATPVGEALLVAPQPDGSVGYQVTIEMAQNVSDERTIDYYNVCDKSADPDPTNPNPDTWVYYYYATQTEASTAKALYDAWAATGFDTTDPTFAAWDAAKGATSPIITYSTPQEQTSSKTITLQGKGTPSAGGTTYAPFEAGKNYIVTITLNGLEDIQAGSTPGGFTPGDNLDVQLDD